MSQTADVPSASPPRDVQSAEQLVPTGAADGGVARPGLVLLLLCVAEFMIVLDFSITNVALPDIQASLGFSTGALQWVVSAYALAFGGFLMLGGRIGDLYGRRKLFIGGLIAFALISLVAGLAQNADQLIALRAAQGLGAALVAPAALSLLTTTFAEGEARNRALGVYGAVLSFGFVAGVIAGGVLTDLISWRWVFFVNVPIGLAAGAIAPALLKESKGDRSSSHGLDVPGAVAITGSVLALVYAVSRGQAAGWASGEILGAFAGCAVLLAAFLVVESRVSAPLIPLSVFRMRSLTAANIVYLLMVGSFVAVTYVLTLYLQLVKGYSPLATGLTFSVLGFAAVGAGMVAAKLAGRFGLSVTAFTGLALQSVGMLVCAFLPHSGDLALILVGTALVGFGNVTGVVMVTISGTAGVPDHQQGLASALLSTAQQLGAAIGVAAFAAIASARTSSLLPHGVALENAGHPALVSGYRLALGVSFAVGVVGSLVGLVALRAPKAAPAKEETAVAV
ncbi:MFS transporter [Streptomyces sp. CA-111067]|uniref:MFS transporter n=1 Tax=Streptomyces sp. CA-111067 TaxID=3240046 RepID=UPI003D9777F3